MALCIDLRLELRYSHECTHVCRREYRHVCIPVRVNMCTYVWWMFTDMYIYAYLVMCTGVRV